ncbi:patatin-like phospholipase family protein [Microvirga mediterraneensis]|uniref:Patatin-like phospholipase family protein n=1 Tax=Microvirga mediterraneensis TaxID=2754695 RepID=A0A838BQC0_9HYPH|nr:patatin-like phospholipase family protein [Microvirga mediterraneensis]MBA1157618.1 patatin-like phospholipase family protein [Microvirga mediterraneensis]
MDRADHGSSRRNRSARRQGVKRVNLALQGGGAHGAFAWGVLDRLLEEDGIAFEGISATSAGAMNAVVCAHGLATGGRAGARRSLREFWQQISRIACLSPVQPSFFDRLTGNHRLETSPAFLAFHMLTQVASPYELNPLNYNPLRDLLERSVDFELLRGSPQVKLFLSATNVRSGKIRVFENHEMSADVVLASACLPFIFQAVEIDGEHYWDGGYMGNPALFPLIYRCEQPDIVVVHINPISRPDVPKTAADILNRINEISFNSSLMREVRAVEFLNRLVEEGRAPTPDIRQVRLHAIEADDVMQHLGAASKLNADWAFLSDLHAIGRRRADAWLLDDFPKVGLQSSIDIQGRYL